MKIRDQAKFEHARALFMNGMSQKEIARHVGSTEATISKWVEAFGWREIRAAEKVTRPQLINKILQRIDALLEDETEERGKDDKLSKLAKAIEQLDRHANIVSLIECFIAFSMFIERREDLRKLITESLTVSKKADLFGAFVRLLTRLQDLFIEERRRAQPHE
ncbi:MAG: terminase [Rikenellaceae bacterium]|nr:terminase [Rikenellaceae bacterium]